MESFDTPRLGPQSAAANHYSRPVGLMRLFFFPFFFFFSFNPIPSTLGAGVLCRQTRVRNTQPENAPEPARHLGVRRCSASTLAVIMWLPDGRKTNRKPQTKTPHSSRRCKPCTTVRARYRPASLEAHAPIMMVTSKLLVDRPRKQ